MRTGKSLGRRLGALVVATWMGALAPSSFAADASARGGDLRLYVLDCGVLLYNSPERFGYKPGEINPTNLSDGCYLIDDPGHGTLIWDTGVIPDRMWAPGAPPPKKEYAEGTLPFAAQLAQIGYKPQDITYVAVSHMHWDHVANLYQFAASTWLTARYTRDRLLAPTPGDKIEPSMFAPLKDSRFVLLPDDKDYDVFGDGKVIRIPTPGHTPDSSVLLVKLKNHAPVILAGDLYHFRRDVETNRAARGEDPVALPIGRAKVQALVRQLGAEVWIGHDFREFTALKKAPAYYD